LLESNINEERAGNAEENEKNKIFQDDEVVLKVI